MKPWARNLLIASAACVAGIVVLLPLAVPEIVERIARTKMAEFGLPADVQMQLGYCWRNGPGLSGRLRLAVANSPWCVRTSFGASCCEWSVSVKMLPTSFDETDETLGKLMRMLPPTAVSNLQFSGSIALEASAERTFSKPVPVWRAKLPLCDLSASAIIGDKPFSISGLTLIPAASGIADHVDIAPLYVKARSASASVLTITNLFAAVHVTEESLLVTKASADCCDGKISLYSLFLNPKNLNTGFTVFLDNIDAGQALNLLNGFHGTATGRLHGKGHFFIREGGKSIRLNDSFLYSPPGETGKLRMTNPDLVTDNLTMAGVDEGTLNSLDNALRDLDYTVLKLDLKRRSANDVTLTARVSGTATRGRVTAPVDLTVNFHGELEQIINTGLGISTKMKGHQK